MHAFRLGLRLFLVSGLLVLGGCALGVGAQHGPTNEHSSTVRELTTNREGAVQPVFRVDGQKAQLDDEVRTMNLAGLADWRAGDRPQAIARWQRAAQLAPNDPAVQNNLGFGLLTMGELEQAWQALRAAFTLDPDNPKTRANLQAFGRAWRARCADGTECRGRIAPSEAAFSSARHVDSSSERPFPPD